MHYIFSKIKKTLNIFVSHTFHILFFLKNYFMKYKYKNIKHFVSHALHSSYFFFLKMILGNKNKNIKHFLSLTYITYFIGF